MKKTPFPVRLTQNILWKLRFTSKFVNITLNRLVISRLLSRIRFWIAHHNKHFFLTQLKTYNDEFLGSCQSFIFCFNCISLWKLTEIFNFLRIFLLMNFFGDESISRISFLIFISMKGDQWFTYKIAWLNRIEYFVFVVFIMVEVRFPQRNISKKVMEKKATYS